MSMQFEQPIDERTRAMIKEAFGEPVAGDDKTLLFDKMAVIRSGVMGDIARAAKQPARVEMNTVGEIKTLADGTRYELTARGWRKIGP